MFTQRLLLSMAAPLCVGTLLLVAPPVLTAQQVQSGPVVLDSAFLAGYSWRNLGPDRGGRSIAVTGVIGRPDEGYFGAVGGGLWTWSPPTRRMSLPRWWTSSSASPRTTAISPSRRPRSPSSARSHERGAAVDLAELFA